MDVNAILAKELETTRDAVSAVAEMLDAGDTIPFIARYRKERTGGMDDAALRHLEERLRYLRGLEDRREKIRAAISEQGKLTETLSAKLDAASTLAQLEDLYLPYRPKRRTRAGIAKERGLQPLAEEILRQDPRVDPAKLAEAYLSEEKGVKDAEEALSGARDILAEQMAEDAETRAQLRALMRRTGMLVSSLAPQKEKKPDKKTAAELAEEPEEDTPRAARREQEVYLQYADYRELALRAANHRILALNRGEKEGMLRVSVEPDEAGAEGILLRAFCRGFGPCRNQVEAAAKDAWKRLIEPSLERELRGELTDRANEGAIQVFAANLRELLMQPPIRGRVTLGVDPGYRNGCKLAVVDETGRVLETAIGHFTLPMRDEAARQRERRRVLDLARRHGVTAIAIGNGTASRESEQFIAELLPELPGAAYMIVNEAGASVWSASESAAKELPDYNVLERGAISIARRLQDPLAELIKIDPKSIGVGQYQHDLRPQELSDALSGVVESCVSSVGVDAGTASKELLSHVAGISETLARNIVAYREENGLASRAQLKKVPKLGPKAFEQCAGFIRVQGKEPLDATAVHPESYSAARALLSRMGVSPKELKAGGIPGFFARVQAEGAAKLAAELGIGEPTLCDIARELERPGRDPRDELPPPLLRTDVLSLSDLKPGMELTGTVRNVTDFGAFVDIGVHQDGLVHTSRMSDRFIRHPSQAAHVGDIVTVWVVEVDEKRKRIALSMVKDKAHR